MHHIVNAFFFWFNICPKWALLKERFKFDHSHVFSCVRLNFPQKKHSLKIYYTNISRPLPFFLLEHLFWLSHRRTRWTVLVDNVGLKICRLGTSNSMVALTKKSSLGVIQSGPGMSSTTNHKFYMAFGRLAGLWCKQPLTCASYVMPTLTNVHRGGRLPPIWVNVLYIFSQQTFNLSMRPPIVGWNIQ